MKNRQNQELACSESYNNILTKQVNEHKKTPCVIDHAIDNVLKNVAEIQMEKHLESHKISYCINTIFENICTITGIRFIRKDPKFDSEDIIEEPIQPGLDLWTATFIPFTEKLNTIQVSQSINVEGLKNNQSRSDFSKSSNKDIEFR